MNLYRELSEALQKKSGLEIICILKKAKTIGISREEALRVLNQLYENINDEIAENLVVDSIDVLNFYCHPANYIWYPQEK